MHERLELRIGGVLVAMIRGLVVWWDWMKLPLTPTHAQTVTNPGSCLLLLGVVLLIPLLPWKIALYLSQSLPHASPMGLKPR
jgi:hypothetical protein